MKSTKHAPQSLLASVVVVGSAVAFVGVGVGVAFAAEGAQPTHQLPAPSSEDGLVVGLCDGETAVEVKGKKKGDTLTKSEALAVSGQLMAEWRRKNPNANWDDAPPETRLAQGTGGSKPGAATPEGKANAPGPAPTTKPQQNQPVDPRGSSAEKGALQTPGAQQNVQDGHTYGAFGPRDEAVWEASTRAFVEEGRRVFHDANAVGGTVGISCDMCHPDGANTHPETYPKYQVQLGRVALLRDMINWCIENPARGKPLPDDDVRIKAMEAYIYAQRKGVTLQFGKH